MREKRTVRGFTLSELLVAAAILALAVTGLLQLLIVCLISNTAASNQVVASNDAQLVLEAMKGLPYADVSSCNYTPPDYSSSADHLSEEAITLSCSNESLMTKIVVTVTWKERNAQKTLQLSTRIAQ